MARILATSRERLALDGEQVWTVAPLAIAGPQCTGLAAVPRTRPCRRGGAGRRRWSRESSQRLDGLPLAIEMAAAQLDTTTAEELADALDDHLDDLRSPQRRVPSRHRSLADVARLVGSAPRRPRGAHPRRALGVRRTGDRRRHRRRARSARRRRQRAPAGETIARQRRPIAHSGALPPAPDDPLVRPPTPRRGRSRRGDGATPRRVVRRRRSHAPTPSCALSEEARCRRSARLGLRRAPSGARLGSCKRRRPRRRPVGPPPRLRPGPIHRRATRLGRAAARADSPPTTRAARSCSPRRRHAPSAAATSPRRVGSPARRWHLPATRRPPSPRSTR